MPTALKAKPQAARRDESAPETGDWIGQELRKVFDEVLNEPIPDRLRALLTRMREDEDEGGDEGKGT